MDELVKRKPTRLKYYDYSTPGKYFVTICTKDKKHMLSRIIVGQGLAPAENKLSIYGLIAKKQIELLESRYHGLIIDKYVIMPNHIHILLSTCNITGGASPSPTINISDVICAFKSLTSKMCKNLGLNHKNIWQRSFHDHIIRGEEDYKKIWEYIDTNVIKWEYDCYY